MNLYNIDPSKEVIITKLAESKPGLVEVGHWVKGKIIGYFEPEMGEPVLIRARCSGEWGGIKVESNSIFNTSKVKQTIPTAHGVALITRNSVWLLENTE